MARGKHSAEAVAARQAASRQEAASRAARVQGDAFIMEDKAACGKGFAAEGEAACGAYAKPSPSRKGSHVASFRLFTQSRDGRMLMFEDSHGHFTCVHARRLAP